MDATPFAATVRIVLAGNPKVEVPIVPAVSSSATTVPQKASLEFIGFRSGGILRRGSDLHRGRRLR